MASVFWYSQDVSFIDFLTEQRNIKQPIVWSYLKTE